MAHLTVENLHAAQDFLGDSYPDQGAALASVGIEDEDEAFATAHTVWADEMGSDDPQEVGGLGEGGHMMLLGAFALGAAWARARANEPEAVEGTVDRDVVGK